MCRTSWECVAQHLIAFMSGELPGEIDVLRHAPETIDALMELYPQGRIAWFLTYNFLFNTILGELVGAILVDAFLVLRQDAESVIVDTSERCFVCTLERSVFEMYGNGFESHTKEEHNPMVYMFYWYYIYTKTTRTAFEENLYDNMMQALHYIRVLIPLSIRT